MHYFTLRERVNTKRFHGVDKVACGPRTSSVTTGCAESLFFTHKRFEIYVEASITSMSKRGVTVSSETSVSCHQTIGVTRRKTLYLL
jgi:hypothetical protein